MTAYQWFMALHAACGIPSRERVGHASGGEVRRWFQAKNIVVNGEPLLADEPMDFPIISVVLFPKGRRVTLF